MATPFADGDRLDLISYRFYRDPEQFWRICDANRALRCRTTCWRRRPAVAVPIPLKLMGC